MSKIESFPLSDTDDRELIKKHPVPSLDLWDFKACREVLKNYQDKEYKSLAIMKGNG